MRVTFVDNLIFPEPGDIKNLDVHPHLGLMSLVAVARQAGHDAAIFDPKRALREGRLSYDEKLYRDAADLILEAEPDVVGFTSMGCSFLFTLKTAAYLKRKRPGLPILLGGPHASILHREILDSFAQFDVIVRHEAEDTIVPVLAGLEARDFAAIPGISWRQSTVVRATEGAPKIADLDALPIPAYESVDIEGLNLKSIRIDAGRGCPFKCTFCSTATYFGRSYRLKSAERLVAEMDHLNERYGFTDFKLNHDLFTVNKKKIHAFCAAVRDRGYRWGVSARVDCVDEPLLAAMAEAGCNGIYFGIETGSRRLQREVEKNLDLDLVDPCLEVTEKLGMQTVCSFITGYPQETKQDQDDTLDMLGACLLREESLFVTQLHMLTPEPGTKMYEMYADEMIGASGSAPAGARREPHENLLYDGYLTDFTGELLEEDDEETIIRHPRIFITHFFLPTVEPRADHVLAVDIYRILRRAGHTIITYATRFFDGRFSRLVGSIRDFAQSNKVREITKDEILRFFFDRFGDRHHLTSLIRYGLITEHGRKLDEPDVSTQTGFDTGTLYKLSANTFLFRDIHDCSHLIRRIKADIRSPALLSPDEIGGLGHYLVLVKGGIDGQMENFEIDDVTYGVLKAFTRPRTFDGFVVALRRTIPGVEFEWSTLDAFLTTGVLISVEAARPVEETPMPPCCPTLPAQSITNEGPSPFPAMP